MISNHGSSNIFRVCIPFFILPSIFVLDFFAIYTLISQYLTFTMIFSLLFTFSDAIIIFSQSNLMMNLELRVIA